MNVGGKLWQQARAKLMRQKINANSLKTEVDISNALQQKLPGTQVEFLGQKFKIDVDRSGQKIFRTIESDNTKAVDFTQEEILNLFSDNPNRLDRIRNDPNLPPRVERGAIIKKLQEKARKDLIDGGVDAKEADSIAMASALQQAESPAFVDFEQKTQIADALDNSDVKPKPQDISDSELRKSVDDVKLVDEKVLDYESKYADENPPDPNLKPEIAEEPFFREVFYEKKPVLEPATGRRLFGTMFKNITPPKLDIRLKIQPPSLDISQLTSFISDLGSRAKKAYANSKISKRVLERLTIENRPLFKRRAKIAGALFAGTSALTGIALLTWYLCTSSTTDATLLHQEDINGCFMYNRITNSKTKIKLLTCTTGVASGMDTCPTQSFTPGSQSPNIVNCPKETFNPCAKSSTSRSSDPSLPLVPNVCNFYLYKGTAPTTIDGVTVRNACENTKDNQACSVYCKTENFNLSEIYELMCIQMDYDMAFADLMVSLGYDPIEIFPPTLSAQKSSTVSTPLVIATVVLGVIFFALVIILHFR